MPLPVVRPEPFTVQSEKPITKVFVIGGIDALGISLSTLFLKERWQIIMIGSKEISVSGCIRLHQEGNPAFKSVPNQTCRFSHCGDPFASREQLKKR